MYRSLALVAALSFASLARADLAARYVADVSQASYTNYVEQSLFTHYGQSRKFPFGVNRTAARDTIQMHFDSVGLDDSLETFTYSGYTGWNIVGTLPGRITPENIYLVGAHWDSANGNGPGTGATAGAPGADDNASGVAGIMEAARVLSPHAFASTIVFVAFDAEELGLRGSKAYVAAHPEQNIRAAISMDMIAYNPATDHDRAHVYYKYTDTGQPLATEVALAFSQYGQGIEGVAEQYTTYDMTDHAPFANAGFPAIAVSEFNVWTNPRYHSWLDSVDTQGYLDMDYATRMTRAVTGYLAEAADALQPGDADLDHDVDFDDLLTLAQSYGTASGGTWQAGDFTGDGQIEFADLLQLAQAYGVGTTALSTAEFESDWSLARSMVPEPAALLAPAFVAFFSRRRTPH